MRKTTPYAAGMLSAMWPAICAGAGDGSASGVPGMAEFDLIGRTFTVIIALVIVIGLLIFTLWLFRRILGMNRFPGIPQGAVSILEIRHIDPKRAITLVRVMDRVLIVAWTDNGVALLGELTPDETSQLDSGSAPVPSGFSDILSRLVRKRTSEGSSGKNTTP